MEKKRGPKNKEERDARRVDVLEFMKSIGPYSVPINIMAKKYNCTVKTIYNDVKFLIKRIKLEDMDIEGRKILMSVARNMSISDELKASGDDVKRLRAVMASNNTAEVMTKMFEQYGFKDKIADIHKFEGSAATFNLIEKSVEEIKSEKARSKSRASIDNKSKTNTNTESSK